MNTTGSRNLRLTEHQRQSLQSLAARLPGGRRAAAVGKKADPEDLIAARAQAILLMEQGQDRGEICRQLKLGLTELTRVRHRFLLLGLSGLHDVSALVPYRTMSTFPAALPVAPKLIPGPTKAVSIPVRAEPAVAHEEPIPPASPSRGRMSAADAAARFRALREKLAVSRPQLAELLGVTRQYITKVEGGMPPSKPVMLLVERLEQEGARHGTASLQARDVEPVLRDIPFAKDVLREATKMTATPAPDGHADMGDGGQTSRAEVRLPAPVFAARSVPLLGMHEVADLPNPGAAATHGRQHLAFVVEDEQAFAVRITGEAMGPHYPEGSIAIICPGLAPRNGDLVLARLKDERGGGTLLRLVHFTPEGEGLVLTSTHAAYPPLSLQQEDLLWLAPVTVNLKHLR